ncbi:MAG: cytochrome c3 family protein [Desulfuromonadales bacterium]|nr:cytochrome c3 family protein [Desulfuromonadales bacterium]
MSVSKTCLLLMTVGLMTASSAQAFECKVCHSKNPKMVAMHKALEGQNCFGCHKAGEKLMGKSKPKDQDSLLKRRATEPECLPCHGRKL